MDNEPFDFKLLFRNPETAQYIDAVAKGKLDLANLSKFIKLEAGTKLAGLVWADLLLKAICLRWKTSRAISQQVVSWILKTCSILLLHFRNPGKWKYESAGRK